MFKHCHKCNIWNNHKIVGKFYICSACSNKTKIDLFRIVDSDDDYSGFNIKLEGRHIDIKKKKENRINFEDFHKQGI